MAWGRVAWMVASMHVLQPVPLLSLGWRKATWKVGGLHARKSTRVDRSGSRAQVQQLKKVIEIDTWDRVFGGLKNHRQFLWHCPWVQIWSIMRQALELRVSFDLVSLSLSLGAPFLAVFGYWMAPHGSVRWWGGGGCFGEFRDRTE